MSSSGVNITQAKYKEELIYQAFELEDLLKRYVKIHDLRLQEGGTLKSLLKNIFLHIPVDFKRFYILISILNEQFAQKKIDLTEMLTDFERYSKIQQNFYLALIKYFTALHETVSTLVILAKKQYELSNSYKNSDLSLRENIQLENLYKEKIRVHLALGKELNDSFQLLKNETI